MLTFLAGVPSIAGMLESLSSATHTVFTGSRCPTYDPQILQNDLHHEESCTLGTGALPVQAGVIAKVQMSLSNQNEFHFFDLLAKRQLQESKCTEDFAQKAASGDPAITAELRSRVRQLIDARTQFETATKKVVEQGGALHPFCPTSQSQLNDMTDPAQRNQGWVQNCAAVISTRMAFQALLASIPLSNLPAMRHSLDNLINSPAATRTNMSDEAINQILKNSYQTTVPQIENHISDLRQRIGKDDGSGFSRSERRALLNDPKLNEETYQSLGNASNTQAFACSIDARYGSGAEEFDSAATIGSFSLGAAPGLLIKAGTAVVRVVEWASIARSVGELTLSEYKIVSVGATALGLSSGGLSNFESIKSACDRLPTAHGRGADGNCSDAPSLENLRAEDCVLQVAFSAAGYTGTVMSIAKAAQRVAPSAIRLIAPSARAESATAKIAADTAVDTAVQKASPGAAMIDQRYSQGTGSLITNPYTSDSYNTAQRQFLQSVGVSLDSKGLRAERPAQVVQNYNSRVDQMVKDGQLQEKDAIRWSDTYVGSDGRLQFVDAGQATPKGASPFVESQYRIARYDETGRAIYVKATSVNVHLEPASGILPNADFLNAVSEGHFPGTYSNSLVGFSKTGAEPAFFHDLAHLGGFVDHPEGMAAFRSAARGPSFEAGQVRTKLQNERLFYTNESLLTLKPTASETLPRVLSTSGIKTTTSQGIQKLSTDIQALPANAAALLATKISVWHSKNRAPFGGAIRSGGLARVVNSKLDLLDQSVAAHAKQIRTLQAAPVTPMTISALASERRALDQSMAEYVYSAQALSETDVKTWFSLSRSNQPLKPDTPYFRYMCEGTVRESHAVDFCP